MGPEIREDTRNAIHNFIRTAVNPNQIKKKIEIIAAKDGKYSGRLENVLCNAIQSIVEFRTEEKNAQIIEKSPSKHHDSKKYSKTSAPKRMNRKGNGISRKNKGRKSYLMS